MKARSFPCPFCGFKSRAFVSMEFARVLPEPGDANVCQECIEVSIVGDDLRLRRPTTAEIDMMAGNRSLIKAQMALRQIRDQRS